MKKVMIAIFILLFPLSIKAYECSSADKERLQKLANNISVTLNENDNGTFTATFTGISNEIKIYSFKDNMYFYNNTMLELGEVGINKLKNNANYKFEVYGYSKCYQNNFRTITINTPAINPYYTDNLCQKAKDFSLCQKNVAVDMPYNEFVEKVNEYINDNEKKDIKKDDVKKDEFWDFMDFYNKYYWPTFIVVICVFAVIVILWMKENKKNKL